MKRRTSWIGSSTRQTLAVWGFLGLLVAGAIGTVWPSGEKPNTLRVSEVLANVIHWKPAPSVVVVERAEDGAFRYLVNGSPQLFIGMRYNPIYRFLSDAERAMAYHRDFRILCEAGVNHITGWDADKGYEQDKFDEVTLDVAFQYGIGVVMPFYLPPEGDYEDETFLQELLVAAETKIKRYTDHPALRMWGVGNEVLIEMASQRQRAAFGRFYLRLADLFHNLDPNHPVIYREAEDVFVPTTSFMLGGPVPTRPWLLYGMNAYTPGLEEILDNWPNRDIQRPLFITEFGAPAEWLGDRANGYLAMWWMIRAYPDYVMGGAPYAWTTEGPEPTDSEWGLMDGGSYPVDETFERLAEEWLQEEARNRTCVP